MSDKLAPSDEQSLAEIITQAHVQKTPLEIIGGGTKLGLGRPINAAHSLDMSGLSGITLYEPGALTIVAKAGTPLAEIEAALKAEGQRLPFEPMAYQTLLGTPGQATIGGVVATNTSGPRRIQAGACRDSLIGVRFVNGKGEVIKNGGRVMKNVTGLDLVKLLCGSFGTLGVLTEVSFKVLPANAREATLVLEGLSVEAAVSAMSAALGSPFEVTGAAHVFGQDGAQTALRVEGFSGQVDYRLGKLRDLLEGDSAILEGVAHSAFWQRVRNVEDFAGHAPVWRISAKPSDAPAIVNALRSRLDAQLMLDWGGGLIWAQIAKGSEGVRDQITPLGGHGTLVRGSEAMRSAIPVFAPQSKRLADISAQIRSKFDPAGILNPGRMVA